MLEHSPKDRRQGIFPFKIEDVANAFTEISDELRSQYAISYKPADFLADGKYRKIEILAEKKKYHVRARKGYYAEAVKAAGIRGWSSGRRTEYEGSGYDQEDKQGDPDLICGSSSAQLPQCTVFVFRDI